MRTGYILGDIMKKRLFCADVSETVIFAAKLMESSKIGSILVTRGKKIVGILTEKDIVRKLVALGRNATNTTIGEIMSKPVITMEAEEDIYDAYLLLNKEKIRHLPIAQGNKIIGMVTLSDLLSIEPSVLELVFQQGVKTNAEIRTTQTDGV